jgi:type IV secretion system protein VirD4
MDSTRTIESTLTTMLKTVHDPERQYGWVDGVGYPTRTRPAVSGAARALLHKSDNERSSAVSSAVKFLNLYSLRSRGDEIRDQQ